MKALVTGGTGFVGSHLIEALAQRGDEVTALVRSPKKAEWMARLGVRTEAGDLAARDALRRAAEGQDVVYHVAGAVAAPDETAFLQANREGTRNVVEAAERAGGPRLVLVSSMAAGGPAARGRPRTGDEPSHPITMYGRSKLASEEVVRASGLPWVILRPPTIYGPRDRDNLIKVFKLIRTGIAPVFGRGDQELSAVYAPDLAEALIAAGTSGAVTGRTYYANHPEIVTSGGLVRAIAATAGRRVRIVPVPEAVGRALLTVTGTATRLAGQATILTADKANEFFQEAWTGDPTALMRDTGWRAAHDLASGLDATYRWYRDARWL